MLAPEQSEEEEPAHMHVAREEVPEHEAVESIVIEVPKGLEGQILNMNAMAEAVVEELKVLEGVTM